MSPDSSNFSDNICSEDYYDDELCGIQLKASNEEECDIISSLLQDSILHVHAHSFHEDRKCLRLFLNRFCWEHLKEGTNTTSGRESNHSQLDQFSEDKAFFKSNPSYLHSSSSNASFKHGSYSSPYFRVHSGLYIHNVDKVVINDNFKKAKKERYLNLLALHACNNEINLLFAGHKNMCLKISKIDVHLKDLNQKYQTAICPQREL